MLITKMPYNLSYTTLKLFSDCKCCFWLQHRKNIRRPEGIFASLPLGIDRVVKQYFDKYRAEGATPKEVSTVDAHLFPEQDKIDLWRSKGLQWEDKDGNVVRGLIDDLLQKDDKVIVFDYKTRGMPLKAETPSYYQDQLDIYNFLFRRNGYESMDYGYLLFYIPSTMTKGGKVVFSSDVVKLELSVQRTAELVKEAVSVLNGRKPRGTCTYCTYVEKRCRR